MHSRTRPSPAAAGVDDQEDEVGPPAQHPGFHPRYQVGPVQHQDVIGSAKPGQKSLPSGPGQVGQGEPIQVQRSTVQFAEWHVRKSAAGFQQEPGEIRSGTHRRTPPQPEHHRLPPQGR